MEEGVELECPVGEGCLYRTQKLEYSRAKEMLMVHVDYKHKERETGKRREQTGVQQEQDNPRTVVRNNSFSSAAVFQETTRRNPTEGDQKEDITVIREDPEGAEIDFAENEQKKSEITKMEIENVIHSSAQQANLQLGCIQNMFTAMKCKVEHSALIALLIALVLAVMDGSGDYGVVAFLLKRGFPVSAFLVLGTECLAAGVVIGTLKSS